MQDLRAVLFDLDGVLIDSNEAWFQLVNAAALHFRKPEIARERFQAGWGQGIDTDLRDFFPGCSRQEIEAFYGEHLLDFGGSIVLEPGARETLMQLRDAGKLRGVVTNTPTSLARDLLAWTGLIGQVDVTVGAGDDMPPKPSPAVILRACQILEVRPEQALVVGDSRFDEQAARAGNVPFVGLRSQSARSVSSLGEVVALAVS